MLSGGGNGAAEFAARLARAGIAPDKPLHAVLLAAFEAAEAARAAAVGGARGLTPEGERALVERVGGEVGRAAQREVGRLLRRADLRQAASLAAAGLALLGAGYGVGRWDGSRQGARSLESTAFLAGVAELNDVVALRSACERTVYRQGNGTACRLPPVWIARAAR